MLSLPHCTTAHDYLRKTQILYSYVGAPPTAYGSPDNLVIDTVLRSKKYLHGEDYTDPVFREEFIHEEVNGVFDPKCLHICLERFKERYMSPLSQEVKRWEEYLLTESYQELASGRQTYDWLSCRNIPAPVALRETIRIIEHNLKRSIPNNLFALTKATVQFLDMGEIEIDYKEVVLNPGKKEMNKGLKSRIRVCDKTWRKIPKSDVWKALTTLSTMTKTKERSKEERRAIVSPNMLARIFILSTEKLSEYICKFVENSAYPLGPIEKKQKLFTLFNGMPSDKDSLEVTGDNTKWNEALSPTAIMYILKDIVKTFGRFDRTFDLIFDIVNHMFVYKRAKLNQGIPMRDYFGQAFHIRPNQLKEFDYPHYTEEEKDYLLSVYDDSDNTLEARGGMFMGMLNGGSTVLAMVAFEWVKNKEIQLVQSSDDFVLKIIGSNMWSHFHKFIEGMKRMGINISEKKSIILVPSGISEFNQMIRFGDFALNCATELPSANLSGKNPIHDLNSGRRGIIEGINKQSYTPFSASLQLSLFISKYKRQYYCVPDIRARNGTRSRFLADLQNEGIDLTKVLLYHGGPNRFSFTTAAFNEISLGLQLGELDMEYLNRLFPQDNPFLLSTKESFAFNIESKKFERVEEEVDRSVLNYRFARNRAYLSSETKLGITAKMMKEDRVRRIVDEIVKLTMPDLASTKSSNNNYLSDVVRSRLIIAIQQLPCDQQEEAQALYSGFYGH